MAKTKIATLVGSVKTAVSQHSPEILMGIGIAGMLTTTVLAVKATPKAMRLLEEKREELNLQPDERLKPADAIKATWKCYLPATISGVVSTACLIGSNSVNARRNAALATAYKLSETALTEYRDKVIETVGEKKERAIRDEVAKEQVAKNPVNKSDVIITGKGSTLCYDAMFGRYFRSDIDKLRKIENELNRRMRDEMYISLNEFYYEVGLDEVAAGHELGWDIDHGYIDMYFTSELTKDDEPCVVINFVTPPRYGFRR